MSLVCSSETIKSLRAHPNYKSIPGRSTMNKAELCKALNKTLKSTKIASKGVLVSKAKSSVKTSTKTSILTDMPKEIYHKILIESEPLELISACTINKTALDMCSNDTFWKEYFGNRKIKFKPYPEYPYLKRIKEATIRVLSVADIDYLEKLCLTDSRAKDICKRKEFWMKYYDVHSKEKYFAYYNGSVADHIKQYKLIGLFKKSIKGHIKGSSLKQLIKKYPKFSLGQLSTFDQTRSAFVDIKLIKYHNGREKDIRLRLFNFDFKQSKKDNVDFVSNYDFLSDLFDNIQFK
jgi:hypothetical protein